MSDGTSLLSGSFRTARVTEPGPVSEDSLVNVAGSNFTDNKNEAWLVYFGFHRQTANSNFDPGFAASFASAPVRLPAHGPERQYSQSARAFFFQPAAAGLRLMGWWDCVIGGDAGSQRARASPA